MRNLFLITFLLIGIMVTAQVTISPSTFEVTNTITITLDINSAENNCNTINTPNKVYMHSGIGNDDDAWGINVVGNWGADDGIGEMTNNNDGTWSITITPSTYYSLNAAQRNEATKLGMVFRNASGSQELKDSGCSDFFFDIGSFQLNLTSPTQSTNILTSGETLNIAANASLSSNFVLTANNVQVNAQNAITDYNFNFTVSQNTNFTLQATNNGKVKTKTFSAVVSPTVEEAPVPNGMLDGINLNPLDNTKATLVLYAPLKNFVHVIGDFNNWQINNSYLMKKDSAQDKFWIELTSLSPQTNHLYQYLVDFEINIADPYSTLILDPYSDNNIDSITYPDLPQYPNNSTTEAVTVLRTGDQEYAWQTTSFVAPKKSDLVVYEVLLRDFDALHSFNALTTRLDYLQELGINAIELMPISEFDGNESWGYNPSFHMALDKYYGTKNAFKALVDECHNRGIAVILDVVYNHATGQNPYFRLWNDTNGGLSGTATTENPFFNQEAKHSYSVFNDYNHQSEATKNYVERTTQYWIDEFKIDGFRWDLTKGFTQNCSSNNDTCTNNYQQDRVDVLKEYADYQWNENPNFYIIFEHLGGLIEEKEWADYRANEDKGILLWNKQVDSYNEATMGFNDSGKSNFSGVSYLQKGFDKPSTISYMESHDEERLMFKNLNFGNSNSSYSTKDINTALKRIQTAGAFFFTVPGPKMIWQFGELGYDISIDENGRTGNKPILWNYFNDANRKEIYTLWSKLIDLKKNVPIFNTTNFSIDAGNSSGLKKIHLTLNSASGEEIKHITILGNFGMSAQNINPNFQETGTWFNLLYKNTPINITNVTTTISLEPGEFLIYGNNPFIDIKDIDSDGVLNEVDLCPNTPLGATVDLSGCEIFTLPVNNFQISSTDETCRDSNNGKISTSAAITLNYTVTVSGPDNYSATDTFTSNWTLDNLEAGTYTVCFSVENEATYEQCFDIVIDEPEDLSVSNKIDTSAKNAILSLSGGDIYFITLNGTSFETSKKEINLKLKTGMNYINVDTGKLCQGIFQEQIFISENVTFFPNPVKSNLSIYCAGVDSKARITVYDLMGRQLYHKSYMIPVDRIVMVVTSNLSPGKYLISVKGQTINKTIKLIKIE